MPRLPADADPSTAGAFFFAHLEFPKLLYAEAAQELAKPDRGNVRRAAVKYREMTAYIKQLQGQFTKAQLTEETRRQVAFTSAALEKFNRLCLRVGRRLLGPRETKGSSRLPEGVACWRGCEQGGPDDRSTKGGPAWRARRPSSKP